MSNDTSSLKRIAVRGSPFECGAALGRFGADAVHDHLLATSAWASVMAWKGSERARTMAELCRERFPAIWEELRGLAAGLQLPVDEVVLWNCRGDLWAMAPDGCTTVQIPTADGGRITHNEDGDPGFRGRCGIAEFAPDAAPAFTSFVYPGSIPGHTFAVSDAGLALTVNNVRARHTEAGVPRMVLTRAMLAAADVDAALALLRASPRAGSFHLTLGGCGRGLYSIEFSSASCSILALAEPALHANHAIHAGVRDLPQLITGSSGYRQLRGDALLAQARERRGEIDTLAILADRSHPRFPIWRNDPADEDVENTLATADIVLTADGIDWQVYETPELMRFRLRGSAFLDAD